MAAILKACSTSGCERSEKVRGFCKPHYYAERKAGRMEIIRPLRTRERDIWDYIDRSGGPDACWPWIGKATEKGRYPRFSKGLSITLASHLIFEEVHGPIPEGHIVRHSCDNPPCCNPAHLLSGTYFDNVQDRIIRGRSRHLKGDEHYAHILTEADIPEVFIMKARGMTPLEISLEKGVQRATIYDVLNRRKWKHVII